MSIHYLFCVVCPHMFCFKHFYLIIIYFMVITFIFIVLFVPLLHMQCILVAWLLAFT